MKISDVQELMKMETRRERGYDIDSDHTKKESFLNKIGSSSFKGDADKGRQITQDYKEPMPSASKGEEKNNKKPSCVLI